MELHRLLKRQIKKAKLDQNAMDESSKELLELVSTSYYSFDEERKLNQRAVEISNEELKAINHALESQNAFLNSFNYGLAHDAKNHTANLKGLIQMFFKYKDNDDSKMITTIAQKLELSANQMSAIIDGFLFLSTVENTSDEVKKEIDASELERMIRLEIDYLLQDKDLEVSFDFDIGTLLYSPHVLRVILVNLISNSLKFSRKEVKSIVRASIGKKDDMIHIKVIDNGIGMDLQNPDSTTFKLFDKRNQDSQEKGFGIGLFMIKRILDKNNGKIDIKSKLREGTEVSIYLPIH